MLRKSLHAMAHITVVHYNVTRHIVASHGLEVDHAIGRVIRARVSGIAHHRPPSGARPVGPWQSWNICANLGRAGSASVHILRNE